MSKVRTLKHSRKMVRRLIDTFSQEMTENGAVGSAQQLQALAPEDPGLVPRTYIVVHNCLLTSVPGYIDALFWYLWALGLHTMHIHAKVEHLYNLI